MEKQIGDCVQNMSRIFSTQNEPISHLLTGGFLFVVFLYNFRNKKIAASSKIKTADIRSKLFGHIALCIKLLMMMDGAFFLLDNQRYFFRLSTSQFLDFFYNIFIEMSVLFLVWREIFSLEERLKTTSGRTLVDGLKIIAYAATCFALLFLLQTFISLTIDIKNEITFGLISKLISGFFFCGIFLFQSVTKNITRNLNQFWPIFFGILLMTKSWIEAFQQSSQMIQLAIQVCLHDKVKSLLLLNIFEVVDAFRIVVLLLNRI